MDYRFQDSHYLELLWLLPIILVLAIFWAKRATQRLKKALGEKNFNFLTASLSYSKRRLKVILQCLAIVAATLALARPQAGQNRQKVTSEGIELVFLFDVSQSMLAEDVKPSRLELAKSEISRFLDLGGGDRVGLIAFAGSAVLLSPMTPDKSAIKMFIDSLAPNSVSTQGTDFERALREAGEAFQRGGVEEGDGTIVTRAVVIVSDGEDQEKGAMQMAKKLYDQGIRIFSLGVGTEKGGAIPIRDERGNLRGYLKDKSQKVVLTQTKGTVLKDLAKIGGGSFNHLTLGGNAVVRLKEEISRLEKTEFSSSEIINYDEKFQIFLFLALILAMLEMALGERKKEGRVWQGRFEVLKQ